MKTIDADVPLGVPTLKTLAESMIKADERIAGTAKNIALGEPMPNVPQIGKFWTAMSPALANAINGQASPGEALKNAKERMK